MTIFQAFLDQQCSQEPEFSVPLTYLQGAFDMWISMTQSSSTEIMDIFDFKTLCMAHDINVVAGVAYGIALDI